MVGGLDGVEQIELGEHHSCAVRKDGSAACWGHNYAGQLGDGKKVNLSGAATVVGVADAASIACGHSCSCVALKGGTVSCWGYGLDGVAQLVSGNYHNCALRTDGDVRCWGYNQFGQLGDGGKVVFEPTPVTVKGL